MLFKNIIMMILHKTSKDYFMPIKKVQTYYEALESNYIKRSNPFKMLYPVPIPIISKNKF